MSNDYPKNHWDSKIRNYAKKGWAQQPSPFALTVKKYIPVEAKILELGTGAGQDGLWFAAKGATVIATDASDDYFPQLRKQLASEWADRYELKILDVTKTFDLENDSVDVVYAHLVLHYFDNEEMDAVVSEIERVLKPGGILAATVNTIADNEYDEALAKEGMINHNGLTKRFFSTKTLQPFVTNFETLLLDDKGRTPKDDAVGNSGMIQFIGKKYE